MAVAAVVALTAAVAVVLSMLVHSPGPAVSPSAATVPPATAPVSTGVPAATGPAAVASKRARSTAGRSRPATRPPASATAGHSRAAAPPATAAAEGHRTVTFVNAVQQTIWVAAGQQTAQPALSTTGWVLSPGRRLTISVPDHWNGRFWGRTGCSFDASGQGRCQTGDCGGEFQCTGYGSIPATLAEFNLNAWDGLDFYDVSMVDGANLPMWINITSGTTKDPISSDGCSTAGCTTPVNCPAALEIHAGGAVVGCESACGVFGTDQYCCRGQWAPRADCNPTQWPIDYAAVFKRAEPFAYSYADDDATSTFTCTGECGYRITFGLTP